MRKICVVTGTRAEWGLLYWLVKGIAEDPDLQLQLVVTGMHLVPEYGLTYQQIEAAGFNIDKKVDLQLNSDTSTGICRSVGVGVIGFAEAFNELQPDFLLLLGDRFEILAAATSAYLSGIPIAHLHGGETTEGAFDEGIRHAVTKMSHLHFVANEVYRRRVIQLGEHPDRVFTVGAVGIENINRLQLLDRQAFEDSIGFKLGERNLLITFHPVTLEKGSAATQFRALLEALAELENTRFIFTMPNADTENRQLIRMIEEWVGAHPQTACAFASLGQLRYLSALQFMDGVVGNSSSGLLEAPSFKIGTINIGDRQKGRLKAESVIDCAPTKESILQAIDRLYSPEFRRTLSVADNPYGTSNPSSAIISILKQVAPDTLLKKSFLDVHVPHNL